MNEVVFLFSIDYDETEGLNWHIKTSKPDFRSLQLSSTVRDKEYKWTIILFMVSINF